jgi:anti-anti-sigma factor
LRCSEQLDRDDEERLRSTISSHSRAGAVVLDLADVGVLDSAWLGALVTSAAHAVASVTQLKLMNVHPPVEAFLRQNNLLTAFEICSPAEVISLWCYVVCSDEHGQ